MTEKASIENGPRLLIVAETRESRLHVIDREIDIVRARRRAEMSVADGRFFGLGSSTRFTRLSRLMRSR